MFNVSIQDSLDFLGVPGHVLRLEINIRLVSMLARLIMYCTIEKTDLLLASRQPFPLLCNSLGCVRKGDASEIARSLTLDREANVASPESLYLSVVL